MPEVVKVRKKYAETSNTSLVIKVGEVVNKTDTNPIFSYFLNTVLIALGLYWKMRALYFPVRN